MRVPLAVYAAHRVANLIIWSGCRLLPKDKRAEALEEWLHELWYIGRENREGWESVRAPISFARGARKGCQIRHDLALGQRMGRADLVRSVAALLLVPMLIFFLIAGAGFAVRLFSETNDRGYLVAAGGFLVGAAVCWDGSLGLARGIAASKGTYATVLRIVTLLQVATYTALFGIVVFMECTIGLLALRGDASALDYFFGPGAIYPDHAMSLVAHVSITAGMALAVALPWRMRHTIAAVRKVAFLSWATED
jgi:hypothetical protein